jgi:hypothetical protein
LKTHGSAARIFDQATARALEGMATHGAPRRPGRSSTIGLWSTAEIERAGEGAGKAVRQAAVETKGHDVAPKCVASRGPTSAKPGSGSGPTAL